MSRSQSTGKELIDVFMEDLTKNLRGLYGELNIEQLTTPDDIDTLESLIRLNDSELAEDFSSPLIDQILEHNGIDEESEKGLKLTRDLLELFEAEIKELKN